VEGLLEKSRRAERSFRKKVLLMAFFFFLGALLLAGRLLYVNLSAEEIIEKVARNFKDVVTVKVPRYRGAITDREGKVLALSYPVGYLYTFKFYNFPDEEKKEKLAEKLSRYFGVPKRDILRKLSLKKDTVEVITFPLEKAREVKKLINSVDYDPETGRYTKPYVSSFVNVGEKFKRYYPHKKLASNLIGYVRKDGSGGEGIEFQFEERLLGTDKRFVRYILYRDKGFLFVEPTDEEVFIAEDLKLSVDFRLQSAVEEIKRKIVKKWRPKKVVIIVMESKTGKIRAFATYPDYDPNRYKRYLKRTRNYGVVDLFEPGSTFKPFLVAYALDRGFISPSTPIRIDFGKTVVHKKTLRDPVAYLRKRKFITPSELLVYSSNVGAVKVGSLLTSEDFLDLLKTFRLYRTTPGVLVGETPSRINDLKNEVNKAYASIGQGIAFNALHLLTAFNALVVGEWVQPSVLEEEEVKKEKLRLSPSTVRWIRRTLLKVVEEGTGKRAKSELFYAGGKTGTAQKYDKRLRRYSRKKLTTFFLGFFPKDPRFTAIILVDEPKGKEPYGGTVSAPYFKELLEKTALIYGLKPDKK